MVTYEEIEYAILNYFNPESDIWQRVNTGTATEAEMLRAFSYIPRLQVQVSTDGSRILGIDYADDILAKMTIVDDEIVSSFGSNYNSGSYSSEGAGGFVMGIPSNWSGQSGAYNINGGATVKSTGQKIATIADKASLAVTGVNLGTKLGMAIDKALYNLAPDWWDENYPTINPQTWPSISQSEGGKSFIRTLFGIPQSGVPTAYMPVEAMAQTYMLLRDIGALGDGESYADYTGDTSQFPQPTLTHVDTGKHYYFTGGSGDRAYRYDYICDQPDTYFVNKRGTQV